jgi:hypothetical protein
VCLNMMKQQNIFREIKWCRNEIISVAHILPALRVSFLYEVGLCVHLWVSACILSNQGRTLPYCWLRYPHIPRGNLHVRIHSALFSRASDIILYVFPLPFCDLWPSFVCRSDIVSSLLHRMAIHGRVGSQMMYCLVSIIN